MRTLVFVELRKWPEKEIELKLKKAFRDREFL
jgi:hypothetical protein